MPSLTPGYRYYVGDLRTGKIVRQVDLVGAKWTSPFNAVTDAGSIEGSFPMRSGKWKTARSDAAVAKQFLAVSYVDALDNETFIEGGPIWKSKFDDDSGVFQIAAAGLSSYFDHRKVLPVLAVGQSASSVSVTYDAAQLGLIAKRLVELAQTHTAGTLPIILPSDADLGGAGTTHTRTYPGYELGIIGDRLQQLSEVKGGPEVQFVPRRKPTDRRFIEWVMRVGVLPSMLLTQAGPPWVFNRTVPRSPVRKISVDSDGTNIASRQWAAGQGEAEGRPIAQADSSTLTDLGFALLEAEASSTDTVDSIDTLTARATEALAYSQRPVESWVLSVSRDQRPTPAQYRPGDWAQVVVKGHDYLYDGATAMRILSVAGDADDSVTLTMAPRLGEF